MIDTVILNIPKSKFRMLTKHRWDLTSKREFYMKHVKNPSKALKSTGKYYPRLTGITRRGSQDIVKVEFSVPKLIFKNNLDELEDDDFEYVISTLRSRLEDMELKISEQDLIEAKVASVHYSKNILISTGYSTKHIISELQKINMNKLNDLTKTRFMNNGESIQGYAISNSFVFYDKISDLVKDKKRSIDRDQTSYQTELFNKVYQQEILRFEVRISQKRKLDSLLKKYGYQTNLNFQEIFSEEKAVKFLTDYWDEKIDNNKYVLFTYLEDTESLIKKICHSRPNSKASKVLSLLGLVSYMKDNQSGLRGLRTILSKRISNRTWYDIVKDIKLLTKEFEEISPLDWYQEVANQIYNYKPYRINNYN